MPTSHLNPVPANWGAILRSTSILISLYGLGLLILPNIFGDTFPWTLDIFHSQLYSAMFFTGSVMMYSIAKSSTPAEFVATGLTVATFSIFSILGLFIVDAQVQLIDWDAPNTLAWLASLAVLGLLGIGLIVAGTRQIPTKMEP